MPNEIVIALAVLALGFIAYISLSPKRQSANVRMTEGFGSKFLVEKFDGESPNLKRAFIGWLPVSGLAIVNGLGKVAETETEIFIQNTTPDLGGSASYRIPKSEVVYEGRKFIVSALMTFDVVSIRGESSGKLLVRAGCLRY